MKTTKSKTLLSINLVIIGCLSFPLCAQNKSFDPDEALSSMASKTVCIHYNDPKESVKLIQVYNKDEKLIEKEVYCWSKYRWAPLHKRLYDHSDNKYTIVYLKGNPSTGMFDIKNERLTVILDNNKVPRSYIREKWMKKKKEWKVYEKVRLENGEYHYITE